MAVFWILRCKRTSPSSLVLPPLPPIAEFHSEKNWRIVWNHGTTVYNESIFCDVERQGLIWKTQDNSVPWRPRLFDPTLSWKHRESTFRRFRWGNVCRTWASNKMKSDVFQMNLNLAISSTPLTARFHRNICYISVKLHGMTKYYSTSKEGIEAGTCPFVVYRFLIPGLAVSRPPRPWFGVMAVIEGTALVWLVRCLF